MLMPTVVINVERCKGCGLCVAFCPNDTLRLSEEITSRGVHPAEVCNPEACTGCKMCVLMCPDVAISIYRDQVQEAGSS